MHTYTTPLLARALALTVLGGAAALAHAQSGSDSNDATVDIIRQLMEQQEKKQVSVDGGTMDVSVNRGGSSVHGNLEHKFEIEDESSSKEPNEAQGRLKWVLLQGNLRTDALPGWTLWLHLANERLKTGGLSGTAQANGNVIYEFKPRWETSRGALSYGVEFGVVAEGRYNMNELQVRPFASYQLTNGCRVAGGIRFARKYLELNNNDPDFKYWKVETGGACFVDPMTIAGINFDIQRGQSINDDGGVTDLAGRPWPRGAVSKDSRELRIKPFVHHRFGNEVGLTVTWEHTGITDKARNDFFQYQDRWDKVMVFAEYPLRRDFIVYSELNFKAGHKTRSDSAADPAVFGFAKDFSYKSTGAYVGVNFLF